MRNPFRISFFHPKFCINRLVGADHHKPKLRISTNLRSWTKFASSEHANENCTKIAQILRHMDESCTKIARIASDEKCAEIARKIARKIQSGQAPSHAGSRHRQSSCPNTASCPTGSSADRDRHRSSTCRYQACRRSACDQADPGSAPPLPHLPPSLLKPAACAHTKSGQLCSESIRES